MNTVDCNTRYTYTPPKEGLCLTFVEFGRHNHSVYAIFSDGKYYWPMFLTDFEKIVGKMKKGGKISGVFEGCEKGNAGAIRLQEKTPKKRKV